jgi:translation initiation factor 2B subunit (eIF-2B alpha/beta/delta family)
MQEKMVFANKEIVKHAVTNTRDFAIDVLLTHVWSCVVEMILITAKEMGKKFRDVVVDSWPKLE